MLDCFARPYAAVLLDASYIYRFDNFSLFTAGTLGARQVHPQLAARLRAFLEQLVAATPRASERTVQVYLLNGPAQRHPNPDEPDAYSPLTPAEFGEAIAGASFPALRAELAAAVRNITALLLPFADRIRFRFTPMLEVCCLQCAVGKQCALTPPLTSCPPPPTPFSLVERTT